MSVNGSNLINILVYLVIIVIILVVLFWLLDRFLIFTGELIPHVATSESLNYNNTFRLP